MMALIMRAIIELSVNRMIMITVTLNTLSTLKKN